MAANSHMACEIYFHAQYGSCYKGNNFKYCDLDFK